jgi:hypothetical protein
MQESATSLSSTCSAIPSTPSPQTTPTPSPLMVPPSPAQVPTSQAPTGHPTPPTPPSPVGCAKPNASRGQAGLTTPPTPAVCPSIGCPPSHTKPARQPRLAPFRNPRLDCPSAAHTRVARRGVGGRVVRVGTGVGVVCSGLLAVREPAGCVHACSKWQTSEGQTHRSAPTVFAPCPPLPARVQSPCGLR